MLKRIDKKYFELFFNLQNRIDSTSKNRLVICRSKKDCKEAMKFIAKDHLGECKIDSMSNKLTIDNVTIIFIPVSELDYSLVGYKYKDYYFEEEFKL